MYSDNGAISRVIPWSMKPKCTIYVLLFRFRNPHSSSSAIYMYVGLDLPLSLSLFPACAIFFVVYFSKLLCRPLCIIRVVDDVTTFVGVIVFNINKRHF